MKRRFSLAPAISISALVLLRAASASACETVFGSITNLPAIPGVSYQVFALNPPGQLTGFFSVSGHHAGHAFLYDSGTLTDFGTFGGSTSEGHAINASGQIVGKANLTGDRQNHAFLTGGGVLNDLQTLGGPSSSAAAINDPGVIVGSSDTANGTTSAFIYTNSPMRSLGTLGGTYSSAFALNNSSVVVGESTLTNGDNHGFVYSNGTMSDLGTLGGNYSSAFAINDSNVIAGESSDTNGETHGFVYSAGVIVDLGTFGGTYSTAYLVNSSGLAIGYANLPGDVDSHGLLYSNGTVVDLGTLGGTSSFADGINNLGQVVGDALTETGDDHAFLWENGKMTDLNDLLPANSGWELSAAFYINDAGRVVGIGSLNAMPSTWFVMDLTKSNNPPVAIAGPDQTVDCQAQVSLDGSGSSDPDNDPLTFEWSAGGSVLGTSANLTISLPLGAHVVTLKVTDTCGASSQANVTVTFADTTAPMGSCPVSATVSADSNCGATVPDFTSQVVATDNCTSTKSLIITQNPAAGTPVGLGQLSVIMTVTDSSGNASTCSVLFNVVDTTPPTILGTPGPLTLSAGPGCQAQVPNVLPNVTATDSCTSADQLAKTQSPLAGSMFGLGSQTIVVTVTDASGNSSTSNVLVTVADTTPPTIVSTPGPFTLSADGNCQAAVPNVLPNVVATDFCTPADQLIKTQSLATGSMIGLGSQTIVVTVTDASGNSSTANVSVTVVDTTPPTIVSTPPAFTLTPGPNGKATVPNILPNVVATDSCTAANLLVKTQNPAAGTLVDPGSYTMVVTVTDGAGNSSIANVAFTVGGDTTPPVIQSLTVNPSVLSPPNHQLVPVTVTAVVSDNVDPAPVTKIVSITCSESCLSSDIQITGNLTALLAASKDSSGTTRVYTLTVRSTDASGNSSTGFVTVIVPKNSSGNNGGTSSTRSGNGTTGHAERDGGDKDRDGHDDDDHGGAKLRH
jgi:probable HAF family extracellular repeat protein